MPLMQPGHPKRRWASFMAQSMRPKGWDVSLHPGRLIWNRNNGGLEDDFPFQLGDFRFHINFQWCTLQGNGTSYNISHRLTGKAGKSSTQFSAGLKGGYVSSSLRTFEAKNMMSIVVWKVLVFSEGLLEKYRFLCGATVVFQQKPSQT